MSDADIGEEPLGDDTFQSRQTEGVRTLLGDPKRAIIKLSVPMIIAMSVQTIYNLVDAIWVSGLGPDALAAVGLFFPFFMALLAIATGIGVGGSAALSRRIGAGDKEGSDNVAIHTLIIMMALAVALTVPFLVLTEPLFAAIGAGGTLGLVVSYGRILFAGTALLFFFNWAIAILRGEGDVKRAMYATTLGVGLNIVLDPIFIYTLGLGVAGAAWATVISMGVGAVPLLWWLFSKRDTYVTMRLCCFRYSREIVRDIMSVGLPATVMQISMSISMLVLNLIVVGLGGTDGVAVLATGFRVVMLAILPLFGIATAVVSVTGAAFGAREFGKLDVAFRYAVRLGAAIEVAVALFTFALAAQITTVFTQGEGGGRIAGELTLFLQIMVVFYPFVAFGMFSSSMFQGTSKGMYALTVTLLRTIVFTVAAALVLVHVFGMGLAGVWWGMVVGNIGGAIVAYLWARLYINDLLDGAGVDEEPSVAPV